MIAWLMVKRSTLWMGSWCWLLVLIVGCQAKPDNSSPTATLSSPTATQIIVPTVTPDFAALEQSVYRDLLPGLFGSQKIFLIENKIVTFADDISDWQYQAERMPAVQMDTWDNFLNSRGRTYSVDTLLSSLPRLVLVNAEDYYQPFMCVESFCADPDKIQVDYPEAFVALIRLSRVGFSQDGQQALVWLSVDDGDSVFEDYTVLLTQQGIRWVIEDKVISGWVS